MKYIPHLLQYNNYGNHRKDYKLALYANPLFGQWKFSCMKITIDIITAKGIQDGTKTLKAPHLATTLT